MATVDQETGLGLVGYDEEAELQELRFALLGVLLQNTSLGTEDAYSLVFADGREITWH